MEESRAEHGESGKEVRRVVICGGGVIGASIAYHLMLLLAHAPQQQGDEEQGDRSTSQPTTTTTTEWQVTVVEKGGQVASAASGKAGGFLALDWCDHSALRHLARPSFQLHATMASAFASESQQNYDYRPMDTLSLTCKAGLKRSALLEQQRKEEKQREKMPWLPPSAALSLLPSWLDLSVIKAFSPLGNTETTAQLHPAKFTRVLLEEAQKLGNVQLLLNTEVTDVAMENGKVVAVQISSSSSPSCSAPTTLPADVVVVAMGPWSKDACRWFPNLPPIHAQKAHSILIRPSCPVSAHALFVEYTDTTRRSPEIYPRSTGEVYICGESDGRTPLPSHPNDVKPNEESCEALRSVASALSPALAEGQVECQQACYLPLSPDGLPLLGRIEGVEGAYVAAGHGCWGILNSPATGLAMAELILYGSSHSISLRPFDPSRKSVQVATRE
ncbi:Oxidoreductase TDA3 [Balamuthia mandrillaris]